MKSAKSAGSACPNSTLNTQHSTLTRHSAFTRRSRRQAGYTIFEVLLALFTLVTAVVLIGEGYTRCVRLISDHRLDTTLSLLAQGKMSEIAGGVISIDLGNTGTFEEDGYGPEYEWSAETEPGETPGITKIALTVRYTDEQMTRDYTLRRLVYKPETTLGLTP